MSKRILMIIDGLPGGGAEKTVLTLSRGFLALGHRVSLFSLRSVCDYPLPEGIDYQVIEDRCCTPWRKLTELPRRAAQLEKAVISSQQQGGDFDLIISHLHKTDRIVRRLRVLPVEKVWFCLHGIYSASYLARKRGLSRWYKKIKVRCVYQQRNLIGVSPPVIDDLKNIFHVQPAHEKIIANPFDIELIQQLANAPCDLAGKEYLLHIGRFHPTKRHDRLLQAYAKSGITAPLVLIGKGCPEEEQRIRQQVAKLGLAERVIFKGFIDNPYPYIYHAKMLVVSSDSEGFGNVLIEALICGTPVVSTRCPGGPIHILTGELARGLSAMNSEALAEKITEFYQHPKKQVKSGLERYHLDAICLEYLSLIEKRQT
ncbi:MAG: N-acetylgalactosamine-N,N'-diacetylbacillosaminyl-diphospho-undecaprenol 4-alpha-N-acetylgalactosaminyltransferase [Candidatus Erwinia impunctatus]